MVSGAARALIDEVDVVDLHVDSFIWHRIWGRPIGARSGGGLFDHRYFGQVDVPRAVEGGLTGAMWSVTTNPLRRAAHRPGRLRANVARLRRELEAGGARVVSSVAEYRAARRAGRHGAFLAVQGGNALDRDLDDVDAVCDVVTRITLVHLSANRLGTSSAPIGHRREPGLTELGRAFVARCDACRVLVDLAHLDRLAFFDALDAHDPALPPVVTHTGVCGVHPHWRNLDDEQVRAVAERGGTIGIMAHSSFLGGPYWSGRADLVARHAEHVIALVGDEHVSLGTDWDGAIVPPRDLRSPLDLARFVDLLLHRGWEEATIVRFLGANALRVIAAVRD